jgi:hypothetical protein
MPIFEWAKLQIRTLPALSLLFQQLSRKKFFCHDLHSKQVAASLRMQYLQSK